jgi:acyl-CoA hydrolase
VSGETEGDRLRIWYFRNEAEANALYAKVWFGLGAEGPPGHAHGGSMAAVLDESMGFCAWMAGHSVVAASLNISFHKRLPLERVLIVEARVDQVVDTRVTTIGRIYAPDSGDRFASAEGLFITQPLESFGSLAKVVQSAEESQEESSSS